MAARTAVRMNSERFGMFFIASTRAGSALKDGRSMMVSLGAKPFWSSGTINRCWMNSACQAYSVMTRVGSW